ncbi:peptidase M18 [Zychaea mexicana]|uniref:peptidase M18 n=1 Tax=Zychaea mexicana TaxID=64656 RepID=UPI0022FDDD1F|nr:peptidase M18 [Zychaea mexicana]KAI9493367.1 peptidase M18 [Zychaea mexicana]
MFNPSIPQEARDFVDFVNKSPSPFHCTHGAAELLKQAGFTEIKERDNWNGAIERNGKYYFTRNGSSIVAFVVGGKYVPGNGFSIVGAHTDSPCLKVKPISKKEKSGYLEVGVQLYGGGISIATRIPNKYGFIDQARMDRDLGVAGCVMVEDNNGKYRLTVVKVDRPLLRIPTLAIHLDRNANDSFTFNKEIQLAPILATATKAELNKTESDEHIEAEEGHHPLLIRVLADEMGAKPSQIRDFELVLYDTQGSTIGGVCNEFIFSPRLDNQEMSYCAIRALLQSKNIENDTNVRVTVCFDNEEIGSTTAHGADSNLLPTTLQRLANTELLSGENVSPTAFEEAMHKSILISADMAHAIHPNYPEKHEENHRPNMHKGTVIKINANQRYATTAVTSLVSKELAKKHVIPIQEFVVRNDSPCGSTIGPMLSAKLGLRTVDVGNPQLSMHSIREVGGTDDVKHGIDLLQVLPSFCFAGCYQIDLKISDSRANSSIIFHLGLL